MHKLLTVTAIGLALSFGAAQAQTQKIAPVQDKTAIMFACEKAVGSRKGDERKSFLVSCLAARSEPQQGKVTTASSPSSSCHDGRAEDL